MNHLIHHITDILTKEIDPNAKPNIIIEGDSYLLIDGNRCPGPIATSFGVDIAIRKAKTSGCCMVGIRNSACIFRAGFHVEQLAKRGLVGLIFSDDPMPVVHPIGGSEPIIGSNPMAIAIPTGNIPFVFDFTPCSTLPTWIRFSQYYDDELPDSWATDENGRATNNPFAVANGSKYEPQKGAINPGGHKGYGMLLAIDFLSGALVGANMGLEHVNRSESNKGHFLLAINPNVFCDLKDFKDSVQHRIDEIKGSRKCDGVDTIRIPGERSEDARMKSLSEDKVKIDAYLWEDVKQLCSKLGVEAPVLN